MQNQIIKQFAQGCFGKLQIEKNILIKKNEFKKVDLV